MNSSFLERISATLAAVYTALFVCLAFQHIRYAAFLEPMEGDVLQHIEHAANGIPLYVSPGAEYIALSHMPLYYYLSAPLYWIFGDSLMGPRLLSSLFAIAAGGLLGWIAWRESRSKMTTFLAATFFFSGYRIMDSCLTTALPDALMLFWLVSGYCFLAYGTERKHDVLWLLCFSLAFWTKQHGAIYFALALLYAFFFRKNFLPRWALVLGFLVGVPAAYFLLGRYLGESFFYHTFLVPSRWDHRLWFSAKRTGFILACFVPFLSLLSLAYFRAAVQLRKLKIPPLAWFTGASLLSAAYTMTASASSNNHYVPFIALLSVTGALGVQALLEKDVPRGATIWLLLATAFSAAVTALAPRYFPGREIPTNVPVVVGAILLSYLAVARIRAPWLSKPVALAALLVAGQLATSFYNPLRNFPRPGFQEQISVLNSELRRLDGPVVWIPYGNVPEALFGWKLARAPSWVAVDDIERQHGADDDPERRLKPFHQRIQNAEHLFVLADRKLDTYSGWVKHSREFELSQDFGERFAAVRQIAFPWYAGVSYPRYLYRHRETAQLGGAGY